MNVCAKDNNGDTPLHYVRHLLRKGLYDRATEVAQILIKAGADVDAANKEVSNAANIKFNSVK